MANETGPGKLGFCAHKTYGEIEELYVSSYVGEGQPRLSENELRRSHVYWRRMGKLAKAGRIPGSP